MTKKIAVVGTVGLPAKYGGFETLTEHLVNKKGNEFDFLIYCSKAAYPDGPLTYNKATLKYLPLNANGIQSIPYDIWGILHGLRKSDSLLVLGVSGCIILPFVKLISKKKITVNIDGLEWKREKWGKLAKRYLRFSEKIAVKFADVVVADNKVIQDHIKNSYGKNAELIAYGADHTKAQNFSSETLKNFPFLNDAYGFKVCRIEPENNIELILEAFSEFKKLNLVLVGNWEVSDYARKLRLRFKSRPNLFLLDPIYDQGKLNQLRSNCYLYVHGHSAGGTNPSLVEAMYLGLPILAFGVNYNRETTGSSAEYFNDKDSLISLLRSSNEIQLKKIGKKMNAIAVEHYTWKKVSESYARILSS
ncbi:DUF1972 domain-containing protein [Salinimicrobium sp. TH3]|uniref:DUF1972 domain-containing protein n=1 Tax=Salinimicrobium sp. TH3 TaxID=2997342 RepID=UPI0022765E21|nr:DUF1972 domain-containing protein [Salinimicrobium sp. TH3]MCY2687791.1 DUF1972 domain-containing protein [Salinimicrobium sp. TH3]